jgi:hypothetical protein
MPRKRPANDDPSAGPSPGPATPENARIGLFLDELAGAGQGEDVLARILQKGESLEVLARELAGLPSFARLYKLARTLDIRPQHSPKRSDPGFVGIQDLEPNLPFPVQFDRFFAPRLGKRAEGFNAVISAIASRHERPFIVETGCLRVPGNWEGDGQSSFIFDTLVGERHGQLLSIDIMPESIETARRACSSSTQLICNDSVAALDILSRISRGPISLLYLDSFDLDLADPMPSAIHHLLELTAIRPLIGPGTVVCVDDYEVSGKRGGKGLLLDAFFASIGAETLYTGYQKAWIVS